MTSLQTAGSFSGDFLEFVFDMAIEYRFLRGHNDLLLQFTAG